MLTYLKGDSHANYGVNLLLYQVQSHELKGIVPWELKVFTAVNMNNATFEYFFRGTRSWEFRIQFCLS